MDPIGPGNYDRAWNDPPQFAYNASGSGGAPAGTSNRRRMMTKRVPIPIGPQGSTGNTIPSLRPSDTPPTDGMKFSPSARSPPPVMPPMMPPVMRPNPTGSTPAMTPPSNSIPNSQKEEKTDKSVEECSDPENKVEEVMASLKNSQKTLSGDIKENMLEDINKRLDVMKTMWTAGELDIVVQKRMVALAKAIEEDNYDLAWTIHQGLIVDYTGMCSAWMVGVKHIISEQRIKQKELELAKQETKELDNSIPILASGVGNLEIQVDDQKMAEETKVFESKE